MEKNKSDVLPKTLNLMILKTLEKLGTLYGYGIARRIKQISGNLLHLNKRTICPALLHLEQMRWITSEWGVCEKNRRAKYYTITRASGKQLTTEIKNWQCMSEIMMLFIEPSGENL